MSPSFALPVNGQRVPSTTSDAPALLPEPGADTGGSPVHVESTSPRRDDRQLVKIDRNLFERAGKYLFIANVNGRQVKRTLEARTRNDARVEAGELRSKLAKGSER